MRVTVYRWQCHGSSGEDRQGVAVCKHKNIVIIEHGTAYTNHVREDGEWSHQSTLGDYTGIIEVECLDCGLSAQYGKRRPKWLVDALFDAHAP